MRDTDTASDGVQVSIALEGARRELRKIKSTIDEAAMRNEPTEQIAGYKVSCSARDCRLDTMLKTWITGEVTGTGLTKVKCSYTMIWK